MTKLQVMYFVLGISTVILVLPLLYGFGMPSFASMLVYLFGEGSLWASIFSLSFILLIAVGISRLTQLRPSK